MRSVCYVLAPSTHFSLLTPSSTPPNSDARGGESIAGWARFLGVRIAMAATTVWRERAGEHHHLILLTSSATLLAAGETTQIPKRRWGREHGGTGRDREGQGGTGRVSSASDQLMNETKYQAHRGESRAIVARGRTTSRARTWG